jgi:hypothetical protein
MTKAFEAGLSARARFNIFMTIMALVTLMVVTCSLTQDQPHLTDDGAVVTSAESATVMERDVVLQDVDKESEYNPTDNLVEPVEETQIPEMENAKVPTLYEQQVSLFQKLTEDPLDNLDAALAATQSSLLKKEPAKGTQAKSEKGTTKKMDKVKQPPQKGANAGTESPAVKKALQAAANAKIEAMAAQQKALVAGTKAKAAAAKAAQAPMTPAGQEVVKRAQQEVSEARIAVDTAKAAMGTLAKKKAKASKAILDAAGGKYARHTGYAGQGGYFGRALRTAFKNGELTNELKHQKWKTSTLKKMKKKSYEKGEHKGYKKGFAEGEKEGEKKELPKAVARAEQLLTKKKEEQETKQQKAAQAADNAALKAEAAKEASKVRKAVKKETQKAESTKKGDQNDQKKVKKDAQENTAETKKEKNQKTVYAFEDEMV